jgi:beta-fructofuranosidase
VQSAIAGPVSVPALLFAQVSEDRLPCFEPETNESHKPFLDRISEQRTPLKLKDGEPLKLDVFLDRSVIEVFANGRQAVTQVVYPELDSSTQVKVFSGNEAVIVKNIQSWLLAETNAY